MNRRQKRRAKENAAPGRRPITAAFKGIPIRQTGFQEKSDLRRARRAADPMRNAYNFALSDWFRPPEIGRVEWRGTIRVEATCVR